jgi:catecholate siderophore receptor
MPLTPGSSPSSATRRPLSLRGPALATSVALLASGLASAQVPQPAQPGADTPTLERVEVETTLPGPVNPNADAAAPYKIDRSSSEKFTRPLLDTSKSIVAIPKEVIEDAGAHTLSELLRTQPGITLGTGEGGNAFGDRFIIRGFEARNDVFVDGMRDAGVVSRETFAIEQVEIAKGPSSTFAGRGTTGAAVNLASKVATRSAFGDLEFSVGSDQLRRFTADLNGPVGEDSALRVNVMDHRSNVAGRDQLHNERRGAAIAASTHLGDATRLSADLYHLRSDALPDWGVPYDVTRNAPFAVPRNTWYGLVTRDFWRNEADIGTLTLDHRFSDEVSLLLKARHGDTRNAYVVSAPERPAAGTVQASAKTRDQQNRADALQASLLGRHAWGSTTHEWVMGLESSRERVSNTPYVVTPRAVTQPLLSPNPFAWSGTVSRGTSTATRCVESASLYVLDTWILSSQWEVFGGLRHDEYDIEAANIVNDYVDAASQLHNRASFLNGHAGLVFKPAKNGTIYLSYGSSSNPSGEQLDAGAADYGSITGANANLDPERNRSWELGSKWAVMDEHLLLTAAAFQIDKTNARVSVGTGATATISLSGEQRVRGVDFSAAGNVGRRLSVFGGFTLLDTEITRSPVATQVGKALPNVAERSFNLQAKYQLTERFALGGTVTHNNDVFGGTVDALATKIPGFWRTDLMAEYQVNEQVGVHLNVLNATDRVYYDALYRSATPFTYIAPGRAVHLTLDVEF